MRYTVSVSQRIRRQDAEDDWPDKEIFYGRKQRETEHRIHSGESEGASPKPEKAPQKNDHNGDHGGDFRTDRMLYLPCVGTRIFQSFVPGGGAAAGGAKGRGCG